MGDGSWGRGRVGVKLTISRPCRDESGGSYGDDLGGKGRMLLLGKGEGRDECFGGREVWI